MKKSLISVFAVAFFVSLFISSLAIAGGGAGAATSTPSSSATVVSGGGGGGGGGGGVPIPPTTGPRLSQLLMEKLLAESTSVSIALFGPDAYWTEAWINDDQAKIIIDTGLVKPGRYYINAFLHNSNGDSTLDGSGEALLLGKDVIVDIKLLVPNNIKMKIYFPNPNAEQIVKVHTDVRYGWSEWPNDVKRDDNGYYIETWLDASGIQTLLIVGNSKYTVDPISSLNDYVNKGYTVASDIEGIFSNAKINISLDDSYIYPYDFGEMTLDEAVESLPTGATMTLVIGTYSAFTAKTGITIQGPRSMEVSFRPPQDQSTIKVVKNQESNEPLVLKNLWITSYDAGYSAVYKADDGAVELDHVIISASNGSSAIGGDPRNIIKINHSTITCYDNSSVATNFTSTNGWDYRSKITNSIFIGFKQVIQPGLDFSASNNLLWNNQDIGSAIYWNNTVSEDPVFLEYNLIPDIEKSPAVAAADDGSYIGAMVPQKNQRGN
ncbi:MAG: hypothetical protein Q7R92_01710 [bacterium]|nr:hypothetical protein [bacterium]